MTGINYILKYINRKQLIGNISQYYNVTIFIQINATLVSIRDIKNIKKKKYIFQTFDLYVCVCISISLINQSIKCVNVSF